MFKIRRIMRIFMTYRYGQACHSEDCHCSVPRENIVLFINEDNARKDAKKYNREIDYFDTAD